MPHDLIANIQSNGWVVHFIETDCRTGVGPWLLLDTEERVMEMLSRVEVTPQAMAEYHEHIRAWGFDSLHIRMSDEQYAKLVDDGVRDPRNGYEKEKARQRR